MPTAADQWDDAPNSTRRIAIGVFAGSAALGVLLEEMTNAGITVSTMAARTAKHPDAQSWSVASATSRDSEWAHFFDLIQHGTTSAIATRLGHALSDGCILVMIVLGGSDQERLVMNAMLAGEALSVQVHELAR